MQSFFEKCTFIILMLYYWIESVVLYFVPRYFRHKCIKSDIILITGAGSGLGRLLALKFNKLASHLVLWDINEEGLTETAKLLKEDGGFCTTYVVDVSNRDLVYKAAKKVREEVGVVTILLNNAGIVNGKQLTDLPNDRIVKTFEVNTLAHYWICKAFLPQMKHNNRGHIVTTSSLVGFFGANRLTDYAASKFAATRFHESLMLETWDSGYDQINFTLVCPFFMNTAMFTGAKSSLIDNLTVENVADEVVEAVLTNKAYVYLPKAFYTIHALKTLLPSRSLYAFSRVMGAKEAMSSFVGNQRK